MVRKCFAGLRLFASRHSPISRLPQEEKIKGIRCVRARRMPFSIFVATGALDFIFAFVIVYNYTQRQRAAISPAEGAKNILFDLVFGR
mgnify:CR=1 FL=1